MVRRKVVYIDTNAWQGIPELWSEVHGWNGDVDRVGEGCVEMKNKQGVEKL